MVHIKRINEMNGIVNLTERHKEIYCTLSSLAKQVGNCQFCVFPMDDPDFTEVEDGTLFISVGGGHNGGSAVGGFKENWEEYFDTLSKFVRMASDSGLRLWMVDASNDCLDDMFTVRFGVGDKNRKER